jgi:hypothetical protein
MAKSKSWSTRALENMHVPLWLIKDTSWMMQWKLMGTLMVIPTLAVAFWIVWKTRKQAIMWVNIAVCCWICANSTWMLGEFFKWNYLPFSLAFFISGALAIFRFTAKQSLN